MTVKELFSNFINYFKKIEVFEDGVRVEDFKDDKKQAIDITLKCVRKYGKRKVREWSCNCLTNNISIDIEKE